MSALATMLPDLPPALPGPSGEQVTEAVRRLAETILRQHTEGPIGGRAVPAWRVEDDDARSLADLSAMTRASRDAVMGYPIRYALVSVQPPRVPDPGPRATGTTRLAYVVDVQVWMQEGPGSEDRWAAAITGRVPLGLVPALAHARTLALAPELGGPFTLRLTPPTEATAYRGAFGSDAAATHYLRLQFTLV